MGLERTATVIQGKRSFYDTDLFVPIVQKVSQLTGRKYGENEKADRAMRIVAEHGRAVTFLITDGVIPSNEGRGYVLRRILRRAALFGRTLGLDKPFLGEVAKEVVIRMGHVYPELVTRRDPVLKVIGTEEARFDETLSTGLSLLNQLVEQAKGKVDKKISGEDIFKLYDTYGFPAELTAEMTADNGLSVDLEGFEVEMERQRERARAAHKFTVRETITFSDKASIVIIPGTTRFVGYAKLKLRSPVLVLLPEGKWPEDRVVSVFKGQDGGIILQETPFYAEMGGQVGDTGKIRGKEGLFKVTNTVRETVNGNELVVHVGKLVEGTISVNDIVEAKVDEERRLDIARNHTATPGSGQPCAPGRVSGSSRPLQVRFHL
jgi:alanyl-tRNA synthetase